MLQLSDPRRVAHRRLLALTRHVPLARAGDADSVHQARVASRRLREFLPLLDPVPGQDRALGELRRRVRSLTRVLGPVRELDVALLALDALAVRRPGDEAAIAVVRATIVTERSAAVERMETTLDSAAIERIRDRIVRAAAAFVSPAARRTLAASLATRVISRAEAARLAVEAAGTVYAQDRLHRTRIVLKKLRYTLEVAQDCGRFRLMGTLRRLKEIQDILGILHDDVVLAGRVRDCSAGSRNATERTALSTLATHLDEDSRLRHGEFLRARTSLDVVFLWAHRVGLALGAVTISPTRRSGSPSRAATPAGPADAVG